MRILKLIVMIVFFASLTGCVTFDQGAFNRTIPVCYGDADCKEKWSAAQVWVARNCGMKIQILSDAVIETYNPGTTTRLAASVVKEPIGGGNYRILIKTWCGNVFGCNPDPGQAALAFNRYVGGGSSAYVIDRGTTSRPLNSP